MHTSRLMTLLEEEWPIEERIVDFSAGDGGDSDYEDESPDLEPFVKMSEYSARIRDRLAADPIVAAAGTSKTTLEEAVRTFVKTMHSASQPPLELQDEMGSGFDEDEYLVRELSSDSDDSDEGETGKNSVAGSVHCSSRSSSLIAQSRCRTVRSLASEQC